MCGVCGCSDEPHQESNIVKVEQDLLAKNNEYAARNRDFFYKHHISVLNIMSSPGSGKTTLLGKTITALKNKVDMAVIVGDQQTDCDAALIKESGAQAIQINTGKVCHLDAHRVGHTVEDLSLKENFVLFIENIGNLVCPASFDLGEKHKVVILSVTEGENKPLKYPDMFREADLLLITKTDLLPYVQFDLQQCEDYVRRINPKVKMMPLSAQTGEGLENWYQWLLDMHLP